MDRSGPEKRIGILGGTFNPVHFGHLAIAAAAQEQAVLDHVIFIPARIPPHKDPQSIIDPKLRYQMTQLAIKGNKKFVISNIEIEKQTVSYSVETLTGIKKINPRTELFFIIGSDTVPELKTWRMIDRIFELCGFIVAKRPDFETLDNSDLPKNAVVLDGIFPDISSSNIRNRIKQGFAVDQFVPQPVIRFIEENKLYR